FSPTISYMLISIPHFLCTNLLPPSSTPLPYTTLFRSMMEQISDAIVKGIEKLPAILSTVVGLFKEWWPILATVVGGIAAYSLTLDRKSTRLNSSHVSMSYAVFCLT